MNTTELIINALTRTANLLKSALADFTDTELLTRPCAGANHACWQIGHLIVAESQMVHAVAPGKGGMLPPSFNEVFGKDRANSDDAQSFPTKAEIIAAFDTVRSASIEWVRSLSEADLDIAGPERMRAFIPTIGALVSILSEHTVMHVGQVQVIRRKLGKPHLM